MALRLSLVITADGKIAQSEIQKITGELDKLGRGGRGAGGDASAGLRQAGEAARGFGGEARSLIAQVGALRASIAGLAGAFALREVVDANLALQRFGSTLTAATGTATGAARDMAFVRAEAQRLGLDLRQATDNFAGFEAAARGTSLQGRGAQAVFRGIAEAVTSLGRSSADAEGIFQALQQMLNKGTVQMEELRGQLGDRLPGALDAAARAMGKTTAEFIQMVEAGQVAAEDFLPRFAAELSRTFASGLPAAIEGAQASINRFKTAVFDAMNTFGQGGFMAAFQSAVDALTRSLGAGGALLAGLQALGAATAVVASNFGLLAGAAAGLIALRLGTAIQSSVTGLVAQAQAASAARAATLALAQAEAAAAAERLKQLQGAQAAIVVERQLAAQRLATANAQFARGVAAGTDQRAAINDLARLGVQQAGVSAALPAATAAVARTTEAAAAAERANSAFGKLLTAGGAIVSFFGGPWVIALVAAGAAIGYLLTRETEADRQQQQLADTINQIVAARRAETTATRDVASALEIQTRALINNSRAAAEARLEAARRSAATASNGASDAQRLIGTPTDLGEALGLAQAGAQAERAQAEVRSALAAVLQIRAAAGEFDALVNDDLRKLGQLSQALSASAIGRAELAVRKFREEIDPAIEATRKLSQAQTDLSTLVSAGRISQEQANAILAQATRHYKEAIDPVGAYIDRLRDEASTLRLLGLERDQANARLELQRKLNRDLTAEERTRLDQQVRERNIARQDSANQEAQIAARFAQERRTAGPSRSGQARVDARQQAYQALLNSEGQSAADRFLAGRAPPAAGSAARGAYDAALSTGLADAGREADDFVRNAEAAVRANERLAEAQSRGVAAINAAEVANRAEQEALRGTGVARERLIALITQEEESRRRLAVATAIGEMDREIAGLERVAAAEQQGAAAVREANTQNRVAQELVRLRVEAGTAEAASIEERIRKQDDLNQKIASAEVLRARQEELQTAQLELSLAGETEEARGRILAVFQTELDLRRRGIDLASDQARQELALADQIGRTRGALQEVNRQRELWLEPLKNAISGIQDAFTDLFKNIVSGGVRSFSDFGKAVLNVFTTLAAQIASLLIFRPVIAGVLGSLGLEGLARDLGLASLSGGTSDGISHAGGLGGLGNLGGIGSLFSGATRWINNSLGVPLGFASSGGAGMTLLGSLGWGAAGGLLGSLIKPGGNTLLRTITSGVGGLAGGLLGSTLGAGIGGTILGASTGAVLGPIGAVAGGLLGSIFGSLFGGKPKSPGGAGWVDALGRTSDAWVINGGDRNVINGLGQGYAQALAQIAQAAGGTITGGNSINLGYWGDRYRVTGAGYAPNTFDTYGSAEEAVQRALNLVGPSLQIAGAGQAAQNVLARESGSLGLDQLVQRLNQARDFQERYNAAIAATAKPLTEAEQQYKTFMDSIAALAQEAASYGIGNTELVRARDAELIRQRDAFNDSIKSATLAITDPQRAALDALEKERQEALAAARVWGGNIADVEKLYGLKRLQIVESSQKAMTSVLQEWLDAQKVSPASSSSPEQRLSEAQSQFNAIIAQVRGGQAGVGAALEAADKLLAEARSFYASGEGFSAIESTIRSTLMQVGHQLGIPGFATGGMPPVGRVVTVGERGPERAVFLSPVRIYSAEQTRQIARVERDTLTPALSAFPGGVDVARVFAEGVRRMLDVLRSIDARLANLERGGRLAASAPGGAS